MADLPDYYTQAQISEAEAAGLKGGLDANKSATPVSRDIYLATNTHILYVCFIDGTWTGFDASILTQGILTLYENMVGGGKRITGIANPTAAQDAATRAYVLAQKALCLLLTGGTMSGAIAMGTNKITGLGDPTLAQDAATRAYVLAGIAAEALIRSNADTTEATARATADALRLLLTGGTMSGNIAMGTKKLTGLGAPAAQNDSLRYGQAEIRNAEIAAAAAIAYSKLALTGALKKGDIEAAAGIEYSKLALAASIVMADFAAAIKNAANGIVVLDASADVPEAQIPEHMSKNKLAFTLNKMLLGAGAGTNPTEIDVPEGGFGRLTTACFQLLPATGTISNPHHINDNDTGTGVSDSTVGHYAEVILPAAVHITQFRQYGNTQNNGSGDWKIQYMDIDGDWNDWVTGITTRATADWGTWDSSGGAVVAAGIRLIVTTLESGGWNYIQELEVKY